MKRLAPKAQPAGDMREERQKRQKRQESKDKVPKMAKKTLVNNKWKVSSSDLKTPEGESKEKEKKKIS